MIIDARQSANAHSVVRVAREKTVHTRLIQMHPTANVRARSLG